MAKQEDDKQQEQEEELKNWDPEAPPELTDEQIDRQRRKRWQSVAIAAILVIAAVASIVHDFRRVKTPDLIVTNSRATGMVDLDGLEVSTVGKLTGPCILMEATGPCTARLAPINRPAEEFRLIGLSDSDGMTEEEAASLNEHEKKDREERLAMLNGLRRAGIGVACGTSRLWMIRFSKPAPDQPTPIFLFKPTTDVVGVATPIGQGTLINAMLLRDGKASLLTSQRQPFLDPWMLECQLAALIHARREGADNTNTVWDPRLGLKFPLTKKMQSLMEELKPFVQ
jgi:hypothetical protein